MVTGLQKIDGHWALGTSENKWDLPNNVSKYTPWVPPQLDGRRTSATANRSLLNTASLRSPNLCPPLSPSSSHIFCAL